MSLLFAPWTANLDGEDVPEWSRVIWEPTTPLTLPIGRVRFATGGSWTWMSWFRPARLEVLETADDALLMVLSRSWGLSRSWDIHDADERHVGGIHPPLLLDSEGWNRGRITYETPTRGIIATSFDRQLSRFELADAIPETGSIRLDFASDLEPNPFLRMLIFAAALTLQPFPMQER